MGSDERTIREVHTTWIEAVNAGDLVCLLTLMADDVVFLNPGRAPLGREGFPAGFSAAHQQSRIRCTSELDEVVIAGEVAYTTRWRRSNGAGRSSDHHIPQTARRPLASGPRRQHAVPGGKLRRRNRLAPCRRHSPLSHSPITTNLYEDRTCGSISFC
jgi:ketosteroid isomerase-like protein